MKKKLQPLRNYRKNKEALDAFIKANYLTHTLGMIQKEMGGSYILIRSRFAALGLKPLNRTDLRVKFILENPHLKSGQIAAALGLTVNHISTLKRSKISPQLKAALA